MRREMVSFAGIALGTFAAALIRAEYQRRTGKPMFPANPKGPLYKWLGRPSHGLRPEPLDPQRHGQEVERLASPPAPQPSLRLPASERQQ